MELQGAQEGKKKRKKERRIVLEGRTSERVFVWEMERSAVLVERSVIKTEPTQLNTSVDCKGYQRRVVIYLRKQLREITKNSTKHCSFLCTTPDCFYSQVLHIHYTTAAYYSSCMCKNQSVH